jgi:hypothetical protein
LPGVRLSVENAAILTGCSEQLANMIDSLLRQHAACSKDLAGQVPVFNGLKLMDFSSHMTLKHISKAVRDELKIGNHKKCCRNSKV